MSEKVVRHVIRFPTDVYDVLREIAEQEERSINWEVVAAVKLLIEQRARGKAGDGSAVAMVAREVGE